MHRSQKSHTQAKKVPPPALPGEQHLLTQAQTSLYGLGNIIANTSGKQHEDVIFMNNMVSSPSLEEGGFDLPRETSVALRIKDEIIDLRSGVPVESSEAAATIKPTANLLPPTVCPPPVFCATIREPLTHKAAVYYHQQLALQEDQGIDLTQSPGRDSPGSSSGSAGSGSRHSTASLDSGRASSYLTGASGASLRGSAGGALSSPRCSSLSSCSIGSVDRQRHDELIIDWLIEIKYEEYAQQFIAAGYDLSTVARMTPEDLTAIGIKNPHHRERIKQRIDKLQVLDNLPHFVPGSIEEWLQLLRLEDYIQPLLDQNYKTVRDVTQVTWEDLEDIGIVKLGHQKKILLAIKRVKDIISGKWNPSGLIGVHQTQESRIAFQHSVPTPASPYFLTTRFSWDDTKKNSASSNSYYYAGSNLDDGIDNNIVLIKVRQPRGKSLESLEDMHDNSTRSHLTFSRYTTADYNHPAHPAILQQQVTLQENKNQQQQQHARTILGNGNRELGPATTIDWRRSYDDGDITPTNDVGRNIVYEEGGGTLPRQQRGMLQRAMLYNIPLFEHHHYMNAAAAEYACHSAGLTGSVDSTKVPETSTVDGSLAPYMTDSPITQKKVAPEPPRRHCSIRSSRKLGASDGVHQQSKLSQSVQTQNINKYYGTKSGAAGQKTTSNQHHGGAVYSQQSQTQQPIYANYATIQQTTAEIHNEKLHDNKSNSSIDSIDTIPFANENTGTIKQRLLNRQEINTHNSNILQQQSSPHLHSSSSSSSSSSTNTVTNITHSFHSLKSSTSLHDGTLISRSESTGSNTSGSSATASTSSAIHLRSPTSQYQALVQEGSSISGNTFSNVTTSVDSHVRIVGQETADGVPTIETEATEVANSSLSTATINASRVSVNVLNDIGNMLANLTDELDAMLEEEKRAGLNIDSE